MSTHTFEHTDNGPSVPAPALEGCEDVTIRCCGPMLRSRTMVLETSPMSGSDLAAFIESVAGNYETSGYVVLAHSITDMGGGWGVGFTVGWYA